MDVSAGETSFRYWAFISYSQRDADWAKRLHEFLESYRIPSALVGRCVDGRVIPKRLVPVFRDRDELPGSPDLGALLREALSASNSLIVICSPNAAASKWVNEEVRTFKASGRANRCFPLVVAAPESGPGQPDRIDEAFPRALRFEVSADGAISDRLVEPLAADARDGKDGWRDACLKIVAGVLGLGFDDLRRRDEARRRRQRVLRAITGAAAAAVAVCGYLGLADADVPVPGGDAIRRQLDHYGVTVFRPVLDEHEMTRLALDIRASQRKRLLADVASGKIEQEKPLSAWTVGEVVGSGFRDRDAQAQDLRKILPLVTLLYQSTDPDKPDGHRLTETLDDVGNPGRAEPILWAIMALSNVLARPDVLVGDEAERFAGYLAISQRIAESFYPVQGGGWNTAVRQVDPNRHFIYTTGMALHMLLELRASKHGWLNDRDTLERMISATAAWLQGAFVDDGGRSGWRKSLDDDRLPDSGITLLVHSAVGRACADAGIAVAEPVRTAAIDLLADLRHRGYESTDPDIRFDVRMIDARGEQRTQVTVTRMIWYPWAVEALVSWRRCAQRLNLPAESRRALDRSLSHLLRNVGPQMVRDVMRPERPLWLNAETYYGLGKAP
jgi:hypothetical protein